MISICESKYEKKLFKIFRTKSCKSVPTPVVARTNLSKGVEGAYVNPTLFEILVVRFMYLMATRLVNLISRFMESPKDSHWKACKRILIYILGATNCGILYARNENKDLVGYNHSGFVEILDDRKRTSSYVFHLGSEVISWKPKKKDIVKHSSVEATYVVVTLAICQIGWLRKVLDGI